MNPLHSILKYFNFTGWICNCTSFTIESIGCYYSLTISEPFIVAAVIVVNTCLCAFLSTQDGEHLSKDKGGQRYKNQGRSRKHKYRAGNGLGTLLLIDSSFYNIIIIWILVVFITCFIVLGHGSTPSTHAAEASKPPPGPRMPDGTRGFAIGRGRPPVPASN